MKTISILALVVALGIATPSFAQDASVGADVGVSASAGGVDVSASTGVDASVSASVDPSASTEVSASGEASASGDVSASASGEVGASSQMSSAAADTTCADLNASTVTTTAIDTGVLAAATNVTVFDVTDCAGLSDLAAIDGSAQTNIGANANVVAALAAAGETGAEIIGYTVDGASLVVYVHKK